MLSVFAEETFSSPTTRQSKVLGLGSAPETRQAFGQLAVWPGDSSHAKEYAGNDGAVVVARRAAKSKQSQ